MTIGKGTCLRYGKPNGQHMETCGGEKGFVLDVFIPFVELPTQNKIYPLMNVG